MSALVILGGGCGEPVDTTIDIIHDPCAPLRVHAPAASAAQTAAIKTASELWREHGAPGMGQDSVESIELVFATGSAAVRGHYDDEVGLAVPAEPHDVRVGFALTSHGVRVLGPAGSPDIR